MLSLCTTPSAALLCLLLGVAAATTSYHVSPVLASRRGASQMVRVTAVKEGSIPSGPEVEWDYADQFQVRWPDFYLGTKLVNLTAHGPNIVMDESTSINVRMPRAGAGVRALVLGDPEIKSTKHQRRYGWNVWRDLADLLDAAADSIDVVVIAGDNFYDHGYKMVQKWWSQLSLKAQALPLVTAPGNHDFWVRGRPHLPKRLDNQGYAFMQMFGMDTVAAVINPEPQVFNFTRAKPDSIADWSNFFHYSVVGNMGFIAFSGAHSFEEQAGAFRRACREVTVRRPRMVLLVSHWSMANDGAQLTAADAYKRLTRHNGFCSRISDRMVYVMGHSHRNAPMGKNGFLLGGTGMESEHWGFAVFDTTGHQNRVIYHEMANKKQSHAADVIDCARSRGIHRCWGQRWL